MHRATVEGLEQGHCQTTNLGPVSRQCTLRASFPAPSSTVTHTLRASHSGTFLHSHSHTPSIAFRHLPPQSFTLRASLSGTFLHSHSHSEHRFPAPSSTVTHTLRASISGTLLQTLLELVTPLKGHSLSPRGCPLTLSAPSERFG